MLEFQVEIKLEEKFIEPIGADEFDCKDLEDWVESFELVEPLLRRILRRVDIVRNYRTTITLSL